ncbi:MAG: carnitine 3-dehydrogenase [Geminicoccaceae bacterium]
MQVKKAALIGGGVIGAGWAARLVENGIDVVLCDPDPQAERKVGEVLANADRAYAKLTMAPRGRRGSIAYTTDVEAAVAEADFIQESAPEREDLKIPLFARIDRAARPDVIIASSTSGLLPSRLQSEMAHPERFTVGHPFNPVYLLPLVEICGGERTSAETKERAAAFYASIGMRPLQVRKEIDGFLADRLMEAMWRESLHLIDEGVATAEELDDAIRFGAGLRWSFMGNFLIYRIAGGEQGMRHFMAQFGPALKLPWTKLEAPELTDGLLDRIVAQSDEQAGARSIRELERLRDDCLIAVMQGLQAQDWGAGQVLKHYAARLYDAGLGKPDIEAIDLTQPLALYRTRIPTDWLDYNGHVNESRYLQLFSDSCDALLRLLGLDQAYLAGGHSWFTVETHIMHQDEAHAGDPVAVTIQMLAADAKRMHIFQTATREADGVVVATGEQMLLHVDTKAGRACPTEGEMRDRLLRIAEAQAGLPRSADVGRHVGAKRA